MSKPTVRTSDSARPEAQPYREGTGFSIRVRYKGNDIYLCGYKSATAAQKAARQRRRDIDVHGAPAGRGPDRTTAAQALQDYALVRLRFKKGAVQEAVRFNHYLRAARLDTLIVKPVMAEVMPGAAQKSGNGDEKSKQPQSVYFDITLQPYQCERVIAPGLHTHRKNQLTKTASSQKHRAVLATKALGAISRHDMQLYMDAMRAEGVAPATMRLEQSVWRVLFNYAFSKWGWASLQDNPATNLEMPQVDNERTRVMSLQEQALMDTALADCRNQRIAPLVILLRETAMRSCEPLEYAYWGNVKWERMILALDDAKNGKRDVALSELALKALRDLGPGAPHEPIVNISYESLKASWQRACARAGIVNLHLHDLRRTAATRMALKTGNRFLVQALTGHKTMVMVDRYVNVTADDVVSVMHAKELPVPAAVAPDDALPQGSLGMPASALAVASVGGVGALTPQQLHDLMAQAVAAGLAGMAPTLPHAAGVPAAAATPAASPPVGNVTPIRKAA
jgi:integrase